MISHIRRCISVFLILVALFAMISVIPTSALGTEETQAEDIQVGNNTTDEQVQLVGVQEDLKDTQNDIALGQINKSDFDYEVFEDGTIIITSYLGSDKDVYIPETINNKTVVAIADDAFSNKSDITLHGYKDSIVQEFAKKHSIKFEYILYAPIDITSCEATGKNKVTITFNPVDGAVAYNLYYKRTDKVMDYKLFDSTTRTTYVDTLTSDKTYLYSVVAVDEDGKAISEFNEYPYRYTCTNSVPITSLKNVQDGVLISWNKVDAASDYRIYYKRSVSSSWIKWTETSDTSILDKGVTSGVTYYYTVRALDANGTLISWYDSGQPITRLSQPQIKSISNEGSSATISWNAVKGAYKYKVYYRRSTSNTWRSLTTTTSTYCKDSGFAEGITYLYTVQAIDKSGTNYSSKDESGYVYNHIYAPQLESVREINGADSVRISWRASAGAEKYMVFYKRTDKNMSWTKIGVTTNTYFDDHGCLANKIYKYTVRCLSNDETRFTSSYDSTGLVYSYKSVPKLNSIKLMSNNGSTAKVLISWGAIENVSRYRVFYKRTSPSGSTTEWKALKDTSETMCYDTGLKDGYKYTYTVRCIDRNGNFVSSYDGKGASLTFNARTDRNKSGYLDTISNADSSYMPYPIHLSDTDRYYAERIVMGEAGNMDYIGICLVCQSLRDAYVTHGFGSILDTICGMGYVAPLSKAPSDEVKEVVKFIFDQGGSAVEHRVQVFYAANICSSGWHESQEFIYQSGYVRFFDM